MSRRVWQNWPLVLSAGFTVSVLLALGLVLSLDATNQGRLERERRSQCEVIEALKAIQRRALTDQIVASEEFLREYPGGAPGISAEIIRRAISRDKRVRANFAASPC